VTGPGSACVVVTTHLCRCGPGRACVAPCPSAP
jgi:hypothetical protein